MPREYSKMELAQGALSTAQDYLEICELFKGLSRYVKTSENGCVYLERARMQAEIARVLSEGQVDVSSIEKKIEKFERKIGDSKA